MDINLVELIGQLVELIIRWHVHFYVSLVADLYGFTGSIESSKSIVSIYIELFAFDFDERDLYLSSALSDAWT